jgi:hypothetical protein
MLLRLAATFLFAVRYVLCLSQDEPEYYPLLKDYNPAEWGGEWDHYPIDPEPYPNYHRRPGDGLWPAAHMQHQWKINGLTVKSQARKTAASFSIFRSYWQVCVDDIGGEPLLWQPCGWQMDNKYLKCSSETNRARNEWYACDEYLYARGGNTTIEKEIPWIKWRFRDANNTSTSTAGQIKIQFIHAVPVVSCIVASTGNLPFCSPQYVQIFTRRHLIMS